MSEGGGGGDHHDEAFFWESQSWGFSNSDNSTEDLFLNPNNINHNMILGSASNSQTTKDQMAAPLPPLAGPSKKRGRANNPKNGAGKVSGGGEASDHEIHIWTERERRKKMRNMFASLHALLPQLPPKADKSTIVDEAVNYIKTLQVTLQNLQKQKLDRLQSATTFTYDPTLLTPIHKLPYNSRESFLADQAGSSSNTNNNYSNLSSLLPSGPSSSSSSPAPRFPVMFQTWTSSNVILNLCGDEATFSICSSRKPGLLPAILCVLEKYRVEVMSINASSNSTRCLYLIQGHVNVDAGDQMSGTLTLDEVCRQAAVEIMFWTAP